ncbi:MAG: branched-chain amino acid ABC transporter permease [Caldilineaceae bacterium]|nr:branched-chain amino acid ABC transporter permease [Caldilineaceae bacterium]MCB0094272.1 branched-chain amino acid ABC transporter permease [Caldilineaceae bacterium]MCB0140657.1 branched-chain amino acid ABC transporter permease [Caldilineaceae bacterium]MCB9156259.1 branched-chain amino acid ABC transporter permease [Caldilineaceae bacterium]
MSLQTLIQTLLFGLFVGSLYGVAAVGLALVFGVMNILNVAHGELLVVAGYISFWLFVGVGLDPFLSVILSMPMLFVIGIVLDRLIYRHIHRLHGETKIKNSLLVSFGLVLIFQALFVQLFTADERSIQTAYAGLGFTISGIVLPYTRLISLGFALVAIGGLHLFLQRTFVGKAIRAAAEDAEAAELAGINVERYYMGTLALSAALGGLAGTLVIIGYGITPTIGLTWLLRSLIVVVLAGTGSIFGVFSAGILLGLVEAATGLFFSSALREIVGLVMFLVVLIVRPQGLFSRR